MQFVDVVNEIHSRAKRFPFIIAVDGTIGSGKSYEGQRLHETLQPGSVLVSMDLFVCLDRAGWVCKAEEGDVSLRDWYDIGKVRDMLRSVRAGHEVEVSGLYDIVSGSLKNRIRIDPGSFRYFILEGLFSFDDELDGLVDLKVFVNTSPEAALQRAHVRDEASRHLDEREWLLKKQAFFDGYLPYLDEHRKKADILLDPD